MNLDHLITQHKICERVFQANTADVTHEQSLFQPEPAGNCMNWIVGHLTGARNNVVALLGRPSEVPQEKFNRYNQGGERLTDLSEALPFEELRGIFLSLQQPLIEGLGAATPEQLAKPIPNSPTGNPKETVGSLLVSVAFHEAYHLGQTGLLRRLLGLDRKIP